MTGLLCLALAACSEEGEGSGSGNGDGTTGDGGADFNPEDINQRLDDQGAAIEDQSQQLDDQGEQLGMQDDRITDLETPENCAPGEMCNRNGQDVAETRLTPLFDSMCTVIFGCCNELEIDVFMGAGVTDVASCVNYMIDISSRDESPSLPPDVGVDSDRFYDWMLGGGLAFNQGFLTINQDNVAACAELILETECRLDEYPEPGEPVEPSCTPAEPSPFNPCDHIFEPTQGDGDDCDWDFFNSRYDRLVIGPSSSEIRQCLPGLVCVDNGTDFGNCRPEPTVGTPCQEQDHCRTDDYSLYCDLSGSCQPKPLVGETCQFLSKDIVGPEASGYSELIMLIPCAYGLTCDPFTDTCVEQCAAGSACSNGSEYDCGPDLFCRPSNFRALSNSAVNNYGARAFCQDTEFIPDGEFCDPNNPDQCASGVCAYIDDPEGYYCLFGTGGACDDDEWCADSNCVNDVCDPGCNQDTDSGCAPNEYCECIGEFCDNQTCSPDQAAGSECDDDDQCLGFCNFNPATPVCADFLGDGDDCTTGGVCPPDTHSCFGGVCTAFYANDADCSAGTAQCPFDRDCVDVTDDATDNPLCILPLGIGDTGCDLYFCNEGFCVNDTCVGPAEADESCAEIPCNSTEEAPLDCVETDTDFVCMTPGVEGDNCFAGDRRCAGVEDGPPLSCVTDGADEPTFTCQLPAEEGESCLIKNCWPGLTCDGNVNEDDRKCYRFGDFPLGARCSGDNFCTAGYRCRNQVVGNSVEQQTCQEPLADGATCPFEGTATESENWCDKVLSFCLFDSDSADTGTCTARARFGEPCFPEANRGSRNGVGGSGDAGNYDSGEDNNYGCLFDSDCRSNVNGVQQGQWICDADHLYVGSYWGNYCTGPDE